MSLVLQSFILCRGFIAVPVCSSRRSSGIAVSGQPLSTGLNTKLVHGRRGSLGVAAATLTASGMVCRVIVLISRQLRATVRSRALNKNLISGYLSLILAVALNALKAVPSVIMLVDH